MGKKAAPKNAAKAKAKTNTKDSDSPAEDRAEVCIVRELKNVNPKVQQHLARVHKALKTIYSHPLFADAQDLSPLSISEGGHQTPFCATHMKTVLTQQMDIPPKLRSGYRAAINGFWINHTWLVNHRVCALKVQLDHLASKSYPHDAPPSCLTNDTHIAVDSPNFDVVKHRGCSSARVTGRIWTRAFVPDGESY